jgi:hypothetical protein
MKVPQFKVGEQVKLTRIPPQVERDRPGFPETFALFEKAIGRVFQIRGFDEYGHIELWLREDGSEDDRGVAHTIWVEPEYMVTPEDK